MQLLWAQIREGQLWSVHRAVGRGHGEGAAGVLQVHEDRQGAGGQRLRDTRGSRGLRQVPGRHREQEGAAALPHHEVGEDWHYNAISSVKYSLQVR